MKPLLPVAEAQTRLLALAAPVEAMAAALADSAGRWAAEDVAALRTQPSADLSAMDGYAIRFADMPGPWTVIGESAAGRGYAGAVAAGEAVRIFTGAPVPEGADTVLVQEEAGRDGAALTLTGEGPAHQGRNIRRKGLDFAQGDTLIAKGERLTPARLALAGVAGHAALPVRRKVRVALAATGDELVPPGMPLAEAQLPETNRLMLAAQLAGLPVEIIDLGILPDHQPTLEAAFRALDADLLVTTGGASVGDHDLVRPALEAAGAAIDFWRIALRPGKPMMAGRLGNAVVLGLPGNPVSAFVTTLLFVRPLVAHLAGAANPFPQPRTAILGEPLPANGERTDYIRAELRDGRAFGATLQDSSMLRTLARAACLIVREPGAPPAKTGDSAQILDIA
ncbi:MAG: gephyrin-like molybdotransferase Glp [Sphingomonas sp.]